MKYLSSKCLYFFIVSVAFVVAYVPYSIYECSTCLGIMDTIWQNTPLPSSISLLESCYLTFPEAPKHYCTAIYPNDATINLADDPRTTCAIARLCTAHDESWQSARTRQTATSSLDIRVSKAIGSRGYDKIRLSVVANHSIASELFSYSSAFKYRWSTNPANGPNILNTGIVSVKPGQVNTFSIEGQNVNVFIPKENDGVRGVIIADPCFTSEYIFCQYSKSFDTFNRITGMLNTIMDHDDTQFFQILGDNFYDQDGSPTSTFFSSLSTNTKSKVFATVPGNHDFWINASPLLWVPKDQQGSGFMQFYGQDVVAANSSTSAPYDLSVDPDGPNKGRNNLPPASNFMFYHKLGNAVFIGFSGAHSFDSQVNYLNEACSFASASNPDVVVLLGHWNSEGDGCPAGMTTPELYSQLLTLPSCAGVAGKMKYFEGHKHCNQVMEADVGFMVGAVGMSDINTSPCGADFGFSIFDTTGGAFKVYYFQIQNKDIDNYQSIIDCVKAGGVSQCYHLAQNWSNVPF